MKENPLSESEKEIKEKIDSTRELLLDLFAYGVGDPKKITTFESDKKNSWPIESLLQYSPYTKKHFNQLVSLLSLPFVLKEDGSSVNKHYAYKHDLNISLAFDLYKQYPFLIRCSYSYWVYDFQHTSIFTPGYPQTVYNIDKLKIIPSFIFAALENGVLLNFIVSSKKLKKKELHTLFFNPAKYRKYLTPQKPFRDKRGFLIYPFYIDREKTIKDLQKTDSTNPAKGVLYSENSADIYAVKKMQHDTVYIAEIAKVLSPEGKSLYIYSGMQTPPENSKTKQKKFSKRLASLFNPQIVG